MSIGRRLRGVALAALAAAATGCDKQDAAAEPGEWPDDGRWWGEVEGSAGGSGSGSGSRGEVPDKKDNGDDGQRQFELSTEVTRIFGTHCAPCHAWRKGIVLGDFGDIYDVEAMVARGIIVPGNAELSRLSQLVAADLMPPASYGAVLDPSDPTQSIKSVSVEDKALLTEWINTGPVPLRFEDEPFTLGAAQFRRLLLDDLALVPPAERANYRYLSLYDVSTNSYQEPERMASLASFVLHRLSVSQSTITRPVAVLGPGDRFIALRIDLRAYGLDAADWARIEAATEVVDRQVFPCEVPFLDAVLFVQLALNDEFSRSDGTLESLYSNIVLRRLLTQAGVLTPGQLVFEPAPPTVGAPTPLISTVTLPQLAEALGVDLKGNLAGAAVGDAKAMRACLQTSSETLGARCVQRDAMPGGPGRGFWWTMDVAPELASNPIENPVGPQNGGLVAAPAGGGGFELSEGSAFWPWPNVVAGFASFDDQLRLRSSRLSTAGILVTAPPEESSRTINGRSCTYPCHAQRMYSLNDELQPRVEAGFEYGPAELAFVEPLLRSQATFNAQMALEQVFYQESARATCIKSCSPYISAELDPFYYPLYDVAATTVRNSFFLDELSFAGLFQSEPELPIDFLSFRGVSRKVFVEGYDAVRRAAIRAGGDEATLQFCVQPASND